MCGIAGIVALSPKEILGKQEEATVKTMTDAMLYRGPDGEGILCEGPFCFGHRRLSIIDLSGGFQPMNDSQGEYCISFNGEIYNFPELRKDFERDGVVFQNHSDTEILLESYRRWGTDCLDHLEGMFAFALWDRKEQRLFCARDRFGKKPFYYTVQQGKFYFASSLRSLTQVQGLSFTLSHHSVMRYLAYQYVPCPETMFTECLQLPPSHALLLEKGKITLFRYWDLPCAEEKTTRSENELCEELRELMTKAVARRMISDVPLGLFLSGGIDSSIVAGLMASLSDKAIETFSIGFTEASYDESAYARCASEAFSTHHTQRILSANECCDILPEVISQLDTPLADASVAPTWLLSKLTREKVTVALGGDGADELWAGYENYIAVALADIYNRVPSFLQKGIVEPLCRLLPSSSGYVNTRLATDLFFRCASSAPWYRLQSLLTAFSPEMQRELLCHPDESFLAEERLFAPSYTHFSHWREGNSLARSFHVYAREFLLDDILVKIDRCSMLNSLEVRAPFLDRSVAEFVARLPLHYKLRRFKRKYLLKKAFAKLLPNRILNRNKRGFQIPVAQWLRTRFRPLLEELFSPSALHETELFNEKAVRHILDDHFSSKKDLRVPLWTLMVFQLWYQAVKKPKS